MSPHLLSDANGPVGGRWRDFDVNRYAHRFLSLPCSPLPPPPSFLLRCDTLPLPFPPLFVKDDRGLCIYTKRLLLPLNPG